MSKELYQKRVLEGLCPKCGKPAKEGRTFCEKHLEMYRRNTRRRNERKIMEGRCLDCGNMAAPGRKRCADCLQKANDRQKKTIEDRKKYGLCHRCGKEKVYYSDCYCEKCFEIKNSYERERRANQTEEQRIKRNKSNRDKRRMMVAMGICRCGKPVAKNRARCYECLIENRNRSREKRVMKTLQEGMCKTCWHEKALPGFKVCQKCYDNLQKARQSKKVDKFREFNQEYFRLRDAKNRANSAVRASKTV